MEDIKRLAERVGSGDLDAFVETFKGMYNGQRWLKLYYEAHEKMLARRQKGDTWEEIYTSDVYRDDPRSNETMIRLVEMASGTQIRDAKHLLELTDLDLSLTKELEDTITQAKEFRYLQVLAYALSKGAKYRDLFEIEPRTFGLPDKWKGFLRDDGNKHNAISEALYFHSSDDNIFYHRPLGGPTMDDVYMAESPEDAKERSRSFASGLTIKEKAELYEAPYPVMLDAYNYFEKGLHNGNTSRA